MSCWDFGYPISYLANRCVFHDGGSQYSIKTPIISNIFLETDNDKIKNMILTISIDENYQNLLSDIDEKCTIIKIVENVKEGKYISSKKQKNPVFIIFQRRILKIVDSMSSQALKQKMFAKIVSSKKIALSDKNKYETSNVECQIYNIENFKFIEKYGEKIKSPSNIKNLKLQIVNRKKRQDKFVVSDNFIRTMLNKLYILRNFDSKQFRLVYDNFPEMVVYEFLFD